MNRWLVVAATLIAVDFAHGGLSGPVWGYGVAIVGGLGGRWLLARHHRRLEALRADVNAQVSADSVHEAQMGVADVLEAHGYVVDRLGEDTVSAYRTSVYLPIRFRYTVKVEAGEER